MPSALCTKPCDTSHDTCGCSWAIKIVAIFNIQRLSKWNIAPLAFYSLQSPVTYIIFVDPHNNPTYVCVCKAQGLNDLTKNKLTSGWFVTQIQSLMYHVQYHSLYTFARKKQMSFLKLLSIQPGTMRSFT